jgi:hypothetical protein
MRADRGYASVAIFASLVVHFLLAWLLLQYVIYVVPPPPPKPISVILVRQIPPGRPTKRPASARSGTPLPAMHFAAAGNTADLGMDLGPPVGGSGNGHGGLDAFDVAVKQSIEAEKTYPPGLPNEWMDCVIEYQVTVNQAGQLLSYKLYGCGNPFIDSAAEAAILMASPYPVPPDFGGSQYTVFGSLVYARQYGRNDGKIDADPHCSHGVHAASV